MVVKSFEDIGLLLQTTEQSLPTTENQEMNTPSTPASTPASASEEIRAMLEKHLQDSQQAALRVLTEETKPLVESIQQMQLRAVEELERAESMSKTVQEGVQKISTYEERLAALEAARKQAAEAANQAASKNAAPEAKGWRGFAKKYGALTAQGIIALGTVGAVVYMNREPELAPGEIAGI